MKLIKSIALLASFSICSSITTTAAAAPDLVVDISALPKVVVGNQGTSKSRKHYTTVLCKRIGPGSCADSPLMAPYVHPAYPNKVAIKIPPIAPGQKHVHTLAFWNSLNWRPGKYRFFAMADDGNHIPEGNEANNKHMVVKGF